MLCRLLAVEKSVAVLVQLRLDGTKLEVELAKVPALVEFSSYEFISSLGLESLACLIAGSGILKQLLL